MNRDFVYLASGSPRRRQLLSQIGVSFQILKVDVDEALQPRETARGYVERLACAKARAGLSRAAQPAPVLGADTAVVIDEIILGKPTGEEDAARMLRLLSGRTHQVLTAVALAADGHLIARVSASQVTFRAIGPEEARDYWRSAEPRDKAGGYAIQGYGAVFIAELRGSYSGVMGLPLFETAEMLQAAGVARRLEPSAPEA